MRRTALITGTIRITTCQGSARRGPLATPIRPKRLSMFGSKQVRLIRLVRGSAPLARLVLSVVATATAEIPAISTEAMIKLVPDHLNGWKGKKSTVVATAIARELAAFIWAISREVAGSIEAADAPRCA